MSRFGIEQNTVGLKKMKAVFRGVLLLWVGISAASAEDVVNTREQVITPLLRQSKVDGYKKALAVLGVDPAIPTPAQCRVPVQIAVEYWAAGGGLDLGIIEGTVPDWEYREARHLTYLDFVNDQAGLHEVYRWELLRLRLRDFCIADIKNDAQAAAFQEKIIRTQPLPSHN